MYFKEFPQFFYDFKYDSKTTKTSLVKDITRNVRFRKEVLENVTLYDEYDIVDGDTPEIIAEKVYGNAEYHWIIMLANQRYDYLKDFPMDQVALDAFTKSKYNPVLYSNAGNWYFDGGKLWLKVSNFEDSFDPNYTIATFTYSITGQTEEGGTFNISNTYDPWSLDNQYVHNLDYVTQQFWVVTNINGTPTGNLKITTTGRENSAVYWLDENGFKVTPPDLTDIFDPTLITLYPMTGFEYESIENEKKRRIKVISPTMVSAILKQFKDLL